MIFCFNLIPNLKNIVLAAVFKHVFAQSLSIHNKINVKHIAIKSDDVWTAHTITASALISASTVQLTISPALSKNADTIQRISYLGLHRLDADSVDLNYQGAKIVEASVPILEIGV